MLGYSLIIFKTIVYSCLKLTLSGCLEDGIEYSGWELERPNYKKLNSAVECQNQCQNRNGCNYWTWSRSNNPNPDNSMRCYLKKEKGIAQHNPYTTSAHKDCSREFKLKIYILRVYRLCNYWAWSHSNNPNPNSSMVCYLKKEKGIAKPNPYTTSGPRDCYGESKLKIISSATAQRNVEAYICGHEVFFVRSILNLESICREVWETLWLK